MAALSCLAGKRQQPIEVRGGELMPAIVGDVDLPARVLKRSRFSDRRNGTYADRRYALAVL